MADSGSQSPQYVIVVEPIPSEGVYLKTNEVTKPTTKITTKTIRLIINPFGRPRFLANGIFGVVTAGAGILDGTGGGGGGGDDEGITTDGTD
jgi:hypothetical protein